MGLSEQIRIFRLRMARAWQGFRGQAVTKLDDMPTMDARNPDPAAVGGKARRHMADVLRDGVLEAELVDEIITDTQAQAADLDDANRGPNGHDRLEQGGDNEQTTQL